jgi:peptidoglycan/xylan/chitin deacetylase (PgdA/CDA1 family)
VLKFLKNTCLQTSKALGIFEIVAGSQWRQQRLLILCYHGISLRDEHEWRPLFVSPIFLRKRLETLARKRYHVLALDDALQKLREGSLPAKSVVITFDDGFHDFHQIGYPMLREFGFPSTVYQATYYSDHPYPVFNLMLSYLFWRGAEKRLDASAYGVAGTFDLASEPVRDQAVAAFVDLAEQRDYTAAQKDEFAARIAGELGVDYGELRRLRLLQLMTADQIAEIAQGGVDIQLHTHRHRTPLDKSLFVREIRDNREWIAARTGRQASHFCYPSGVHREEFLPWLRGEGVVSATTCECGLASRTTEPLVLPRLLDSALVSELDFEAWLAGVRDLLPLRRG